MIISVNIPTSADTKLSELAKREKLSKSAMVNKLIAGYEQLNRSFEDEKKERLEAVIVKIIKDVEDIKKGQKAIVQGFLIVNNDKVKEHLMKASKEGRSDALIDYILGEGL